VYGRFPPYSPKLNRFGLPVVEESWYGLEFLKTKWRPQAKQRR
jgi:hypothetical protein